MEAEIPLVAREDEISLRIIIEVVAKDVVIDQLVKYAGKLGILQMFATTSIIRSSSLLLIPTKTMVEIINKVTMASSLQY